MTSVARGKKAKRIAILSTLVLLVVAALCFLFGFAISEGWEAVGRWFTSKWATLTVVTALLAATVLLYAYFAVKDKEDFK